MDIAKGVVDKITKVVMHYSDVEMQVREATNDDPWGPTGQMLHKLATNTHTKDTYVDTMYMLWKRMLHENKNNHRRIHKSLVILSYLLKHGSERIISSATDRLHDIKLLAEISCVDEHGRDQADKIRSRVEEIVSLLRNRERLKQERLTAQKNFNKILGFSHELASNYADDWVDEPRTSSDHHRHTNRKPAWKSNEYKDDLDDSDADEDYNAFTSPNNHKEYFDKELKIHTYSDNFNDGNYHDDVDEKDGGSEGGNTYVDEVEEEEEEKGEECFRKEAVDDDSFNPRRFERGQSEIIVLETNNVLRQVKSLDIGNQNPAVENSDVIDLKITQSNNNDLNNNSHDNDSIPSFKKEVDTINIDNLFDPLRQQPQSASVLTDNSLVNNKSNLLLDTNNNQLYAPNNLPQQSPLTYQLNTTQYNSKMLNRQQSCPPINSGFPYQYNIQQQNTVPQFFMQQNVFQQNSQYSNMIGQHLNLSQPIGMQQTSVHLNENDKSLI